MDCRRLVLVVILLVPLAGCTKRYLVATPNLLHNEDPQVAFADCPEGCRKPEMEVLYVTDRARASNAPGAAYGSGRAIHLAYGSASVALDPNKPWNDLVRDSTRPTRQNQYLMKIAACKEEGRFDHLASLKRVNVGGVQQASALTDFQDYEERALQTFVCRKLAATNRKDVYLFIHGFNNSFDDAIFRAAELWHFLGRSGVAVAYSWPAGHGGLLGYAYDRESGEFTVTHLKQFLRAVSACPQVERLHIVAHSRGTDVAISALRELHILYQAQGKSTKDELKLENLVLAAPDLDEDVFIQRFLAENMLDAARRTTFYASRRDRALEVADWVFASKKRLGVMAPRDFSPKFRQALAKLPNVQFVECQVSHASLSHDYVFAHPAAMSDLILVLRDRRGPGEENGRPLRQPVEGIWEVSEDYPRAPAAEKSAP